MFNQLPVFLSCLEINVTYLFYDLLKSGANLWVYMESDLSFCDIKVQLRRMAEMKIDMSQKHIFLQRQ